MRISLPLNRPPYEELFQPLLSFSLSGSQGFGIFGFSKKELYLPSSNLGGY